MSNLSRNAAALEMLGDLGISPSLVAALELGIKEPYMRADGTVSDGVLAYPLGAADGRRRYGYLNLPGLTASPDHPVAWGPGHARTVLHGERGDLLVLASPLDVFRVRSSAERRGLGLAAVASSQPDVTPADWDDPAFWGRWTRVVIAEDVAAAVRTRIAAIARRPVLQSVDRPIAESQDDDAETRLDRWVDAMLDTSRPVGAALAASRYPTSDRPGDFAADPLALHGGFAAGHLFYPFRVERRQAGVAGDRAARLLHSYQTLVVRSDGAVLDARTLPAPAGTPSAYRVHALSDGTRIASLPEPSRNPTWSLEGIQSFVAARTEGRDPCARPACDVMEDVHRLIASRVSLPDPDDVWVSATFVVMSHMFRIFGALPILLIEGERGTGKSELAAAIASLAFNAVTMGQGSAAALVRLTRECGGLVVLDDAEGLSAGGTGFGELAQCLKVGYRASTARKPITLPGGRVETFDFFGPRMITCTRGVDPVLGSRCVRITSAIGVPAAEDADVDALAVRDELHALAMSRAADIEGVYATMMAATVDRDGEIWTPLLSIAQTLGSDAALAAMGRARDRRV
ncbi:hypothetical protein [Sphingomonas sp. 28-62-11]|uniref:hypothetical protein n=1 Tax=Sphingomonas sp. 28-62-11 TaxID=1970432 RepID=UPI000BD7224B|nr:MAG: hypothetical protein B7Y49_02070 [Sphingomonas sp. 28-62-11]